MNKLRNVRGFSLIEILTVVVVIGILAAFVIPALLPARDEAYVTAMKNSLKAMAESQEVYKNENDQYASTLSALTTATGWEADQDVTITLNISHVQYGFIATAEHSKTAAECGLYWGASGPGGTPYNNRTGCAENGLPAAGTHGY